MDDDRQPEDVTGESARNREAPAEAPRHQPRKKRRLGLKLAGAFFVLPLLLLGAWTAIALNWTYSRGERAGYIQKFSQKGWICKTWEGDMAMSTIPGSLPERFSFSVRDDSVARALTSMMGSRVSISYDQHRGVPGSCFGESQYFVTGVKAVAGP